MSENSLYLKVGQVAEMLDMNIATIYNKCKSGEIPSIKVGEKAVRIPRAAFEAYLSRLHGEATAHQGRDLLDAVYARADEPRAALERQALNFSNRVGYSGVIIDGAVPRSARERAETLFDYLVEISQVGPHGDLDPARQVDLGPDAAEWSEIEDEIIDKIAAALPAKYELTLGEGCPGDVVIVNTEEEA